MFAREGIPFPGIPEEWLAGLRQVHEWLYSTRQLPCSPYFLSYFIREVELYWGGGRVLWGGLPPLYVAEVPGAQGEDDSALDHPCDLSFFAENAQTTWKGNYVLLAYAGHGTNSYAIHVYAVHDPVALFLQIGWGGAYMDHDEDVKRMGDIFERSGQVIEGVQDSRESGQLKPGRRLLIVISDFYGSRWRWLDQDGEGAHEPSIERPGSEILREVLGAVRAL